MWMLPRACSVQSSFFPDYMEAHHGGKPFCDFWATQRSRSGWCVRTAQTVSYAGISSPPCRDVLGGHAHISVHDAVGVQVGQAAGSAQADVQQAGLPGQGCWPRQQGIQRPPARQRRSAPARRPTGHETGKQQRGREEAAGCAPGNHEQHKCRQGRQLLASQLPLELDASRHAARPTESKGTAVSSGNGTTFTAAARTRLLVRNASALAGWAWDGLKLLPMVQGWFELARLDAVSL